MDYPGKVITKNQVTPTQTSATGVWTLDDAAAAVKNNNWPVAGVPNPISKSLRFNSADTAYLNRTPSVAGNRRTFTLNFWAKLTGTGIGYFIAATGASGNNMTSFYWRGLSGTAKIEFEHFNGTTYNLTTDAVFRDPSAWYMITVAVDTTQATAANRTKIYVNNVQQTVTGSYVPQNTDLFINNNTEQDIGASINANAGRGNYFNGYLTEINLIDGSALTPSSFGMTDPITGVWEPLKYSGTYGTNGFYLNFKDATSTTTLGLDYSGNANNWTTNNFSVTAGAGNDSLTDVPTPWIAFNTTGDVGGVFRGNYCTWNPLMKASQVTLTNGNLDAAHGTFGSNTGVFGGIAVSSGKWYWEETITALSSGAPYIGIMKPEAITQTFTTLYANTTSGYAYRSTGDKRTNSSDSAYGASYTTNDVIGVALDMDAGTLVFYKNGVSQGTAFSSLSGTFVAADANGTSGGTYSSTINFGQRPFAYTPPSGFLSLCTTNLPASTVLKGSEYMNVALYTGNGTSQTIDTGLQPDFIWIKRRNGAAAHTLTDSVRGTSKQLFTNLTDAEQTDADSGVTAISSSSMTLGDNNLAVGSVNGSGSTYVAWNWKANGAGVSNTAGTITSTVSANTTSGFSIVTYTGNGTIGATIGHGLGVAPSMLIVKQRTGGLESWQVYHTTLGATQYVQLNSTGAAASNINRWNNTAPTSTVFTVYNDTINNGNTNTYVAYCFAAISGFSAFGSYTGNGSADGPFVYLGFRPAFVMFRNSQTVSDWWIYDTKRNTFNVMDSALRANVSDAELTYAFIDTLSNGFKLRNTGGDGNRSGETIIYAAFAENPFKNALAR
jgi:hypothetical protein